MLSVIYPKHTNMIFCCAPRSHSLVIKFSIMCSYNYESYLKKMEFIKDAHTQASQLICPCLDAQTVRIWRNYFTHTSCPAMIIGLVPVCLWFSSTTKDCQHYPAKDLKFCLSINPLFDSIASSENKLKNKIATMENDRMLSPIFYSMSFTSLYMYQIHCFDHQSSISSKQTLPVSSVYSSFPPITTKDLLLSLVVILFFPFEYFSYLKPTFNAAI